MQEIISVLSADESANYYKAPSLVTSLSQFDYYRSLYRSYAYTGQTESGRSFKTNNSEYYVVSLYYNLVSCVVARLICFVTYRMGQKTATFLNVDNSAMVSGRKACDMSKVCKFCLEKNMKLAQQCV